jgi:acetyl esterase/lipase
MDIYAPKDAQAVPVVVLVPGGPFCFGNRHYLANLAAAMADEGLLVLDIDHRSSATSDTEADAQRDLACAIAWARDHATEYGGDPSRVVAAGHSYGGYLLMRSLLDGPDAASCDGRRTLPDAYVSLGKIRVERPVPAGATSDVPLTLVIGTLDDEYSLARDFHDALVTAGYDVTLVVAEGADHDSVIDGRRSVPTIPAILEAAGD